MRRRVGGAAEVAAELEIAGADGVGAVLVPDDIERRSGAELPARDGAGADAAEVEVGIASFSPAALRRTPLYGSYSLERGRTSA